MSVSRVLEEFRDGENPYTDCPCQIERSRSSMTLKSPGAVASTSELVCDHNWSQKCVLLVEHGRSWSQSGPPRTTCGCQPIAACLKSVGERSAESACHRLQSRCLSDTTHPHVAAPSPHDAPARANGIFYIFCLPSWVSDPHLHCVRGSFSWQVAGSQVLALRLRQPHGLCAREPAGCPCAGVGLAASAAAWPAAGGGGAGQWRAAGPQALALQLRPPLSPRGGLVVRDDGELQSNTPSAPTLCPRPRGWAAEKNASHHPPSSSSQATPPGIGCDESRKPTPPQPELTVHPPGAGLQRKPRANTPPATRRHPHPPRLRCGESCEPPPTQPQL